MQFPDLTSFAVYSGDESYEGLKLSTKSYECSHRAFITAENQMATSFRAVKTLLTQCATQVLFKHKNAQINGRKSKNF